MHGPYHTSHIPLVYRWTPRLLPLGGISYVGLDCGEDKKSVVWIFTPFRDSLEVDPAIFLVVGMGA